VLLVPHRCDSRDETALPGACHRIPAIVQAAGGPNDAYPLISGMLLLADRSYRVAGQYSH
jgi:hypothetical protein